MNFKPEQFTVGTKAMVLFEKMNGGQSLLNVMAQDGKNLDEMTQIMACAYMNNDINSYSDFFNHPDYDELVFNRPLLGEIFKRINGDVEKKLKLYPLPQK